MSVTLLVLLGLGVCFGLYDAFSGNSDNDDDSEEPLPEDPETRTVILDDGDEVVGTDVDTIWIGGDIETQQAVTVSVQSGAADDVFSVFGSSTLYGGAGDDRFEVGGYASIVMGEEGNDTIVSGDNPSGQLYGGTGDDLIDIDVSGAQFEGMSASGDAGNDTLSVSIYSHDRFEGSVVPVGLYGGDDADLFEVTLTPRAVVFDPDGPAPQPAISLVIGDFEPGLDRLEIDASDPTGTMILRTAELLVNDQGAYTDLVLGYETPEGAGVDGENAQVEIIRIVNITSIQMSDITLTGLQPAA